jgi:chemotaxis receptor (MCP) glutamine deamidase CheD
MPGWTMSEPSSTTPAPATATSESFDPQRRRLCADGSCVGLVGADGRCRVCGLAHP